MGAAGLKHTIVMVLASVTFEWSAAKMVHFCLKVRQLRLQLQTSHFRSEISLIEPILFCL